MDNNHLIDLDARNIKNKSNFKFIFMVQLLLRLKQKCISNGKLNRFNKKGNNVQKETIKSVPLSSMSSSSSNINKLNCYDNYGYGQITS
jgi:hypothetical protein